MCTRVGCAECLCLAAVVPQAAVVPTDLAPAAEMVAMISGYLGQLAVTWLGVAALPCTETYSECTAASGGRRCTAFEFCMALACVLL
jgi:hypothetical protein